jgi:protein associated with RNAse G/E
VLTIADKLLRRKLKYDGSIRLEMEMDLVESSETALVGYSAPEGHLWRYGGEAWRPCTLRWLTYNFFDRWYSVSAVYTPEGEFRFYYCDIQTPAERTGEWVDCVDLDLDVVFRADGSARLLDEDEFELHQRQMAYPADLIARARQAVEEVHEAQARLEAPFDGSCAQLLGRSWPAQRPR